MNRVKGRIIEKYGSYKAFAEASGIERHQLYNKLNGSRPFSDEQKETVARLLGEERKGLFSEGEDSEVSVDRQ